MIQVSTAARDLCWSSLVWDAHAGVFPDPKTDLSILQSWRESGANYLSINVGFDVLSPAQTLSTLAAYRRYVLQNAEDFVLAAKVDDIHWAQRAGKLAVSFDIEGTNALDGELDRIDVFHALGVRQMLFAYNLNNAAAGGCHDQDCGLTAFGKAVVDRMNEVGMIVDASHVGRRTSLDIIERSRTPVVFSHSNPSAVWPHARNIDDEQIKACAGSDGVVGINGMGIFLGRNDTSAETLVAHISHLADLVGSRHIGFGFDFSPQSDIDVGAILAKRPDYWPKGNLYDTPNIAHAGPDLLPNVIDILLDRGFSAEELSAMLGGNFLRVALKSW